MQLMGFPMSYNTPSLLATAVAFFMLSSQQIFAQDDADGAAVAAVSGVPTAIGVAQNGWRNQWGIGVIANPTFVGSKEYNIRPIPYVDFRYMDHKGTKFFANVPQGVGGFIYRQRDQQTGRFINVGAALAPGFNVRDDSISGLDEIGISAEARVLLEAGGRSWAASAVIAQDIGSGHEGAYIDLSINRRGRLGKGSGFYAFGPSLRVGDNTYKESFFNVSAAESIASGLAEYDPDAGAERLGLQGLVSLPMGKSKWRFTSILRVSTLLDDAADSPIIEDEMQLFFLTSFTRPF
ncbi:MAG: outer membrane protein [Candidatus Azotimanducaceae bacterium]|jgi:outer membrane protein